MTPLAILFLILAVGCRAIGELQQHGKLRWTRNQYGFWGSKSDIRKYDFDSNMGRLPSKNNWYTKLFKIRFKERWFTSTNFTVAFTDGYHASQSVSFICLAGSLSMFSGYSFWWFWIGIVGLHATFYRIFSK